ncbi:hypothetical protein G3T14_20170 [Methylobacterium sp. BTF04]|uniref:hypothetical protein n=1 Tax=Methylobacterium sp. BTF04 TaxID=2708300 RepID=UPI0013D1E58F|nr:hypothetical protein [Methylobacterium sp. BTF04]NEU14422.1 hypothetical protein [Methylobacterium sp. BTF04]
MMNPVWSSLAVAICAVGMLAAFLALRRLPTPHGVQVTESKHIPADVINCVIFHVYRSSASNTTNRRTGSRMPAAA